MVTADTSIRASAGIAVTAVAGIAATISFGHIRDLALAHGQPVLDATLLPLSIDGMVLASGLALLHEARASRKAPALAWASLGAGAGATIAANVLFGVKFGVIGALVSAWPALAFCLAAEVLMVMIRRSRPDRKPDRDPVTVPAMSNGHDPDLARFRPYLSEGKVPSIREIKTSLSCAQPRATEVQNRLREVLAGTSR